MKKILLIGIIILLPLNGKAKTNRYIFPLMGGPKINLSLEKENLSMEICGELIIKLIEKQLLLRTEPLKLSTEGRGNLNFNTDITFDVMILFPANRYVTPYGYGGFSTLINFEKETTSLWLRMGGGIEFFLSKGLYSFGEIGLLIHSTSTTSKSAIQISGGFRFGR